MKENTSYTNTYRGYHYFMTRISLLTDMLGRILILCFVGHIAFSLYYIYTFLDSHFFTNLANYYVLTGNVQIDPEAIVEMEIMGTLMRGSNQYFYDQYTNNYFPSIFVSSIYTFVGFGFLFYSPVVFAFFYFRKVSKNVSGKQYVRGPRMLPVNELINLVKSRDTFAPDKVTFHLADVPIPHTEENKHTLLIGKPGSGKTNVINGMISSIIDKKQKAIIYDLKGDFTPMFYRPGVDYIFNPLDQRCLRWNIFNEIESFMDVDAIAHSLIPDARDTDRFWNDSARNVLRGLINHCFITGQGTINHLWKLVKSDADKQAEILREHEAGAAGYTAIQNPTSPQAIGILSVMMQYTRALEYMTKMEGSFSISNWIEDGEEGIIFVTNYSDVQDTLRPILSLFIDILARKILSLSDSNERRIFFILDEIVTLQQLAKIKEMITISRSKGGCVVFAMQDIGQLERLYTRETAQAICNVATALYFSVSDPYTREYISKRIGNVEYRDYSESLQMGTDNIRDGMGLAERSTIEALLLPSELGELPDLSAYLSLDSYGNTKLKFPYKKRYATEAAFLCRDDLKMTQLTATQQSDSDSTSNLPPSSSSDSSLGLSSPASLDKTSDPLLDKNDGLGKNTDPSVNTEQDHQLGHDLNDIF